jgi:hypothetical protein
MAKIKDEKKKISTIIKKAVKFHGVRIKIDKDNNCTLSVAHLESLVCYAKLNGYTAGYLDGKNFVKKWMQKQLGTLIR